MNFHWSQGHLIFFLSITALTHGRYLFSGMGYLGFLGSFLGQFCITAWQWATQATYAIGTLTSRMGTTVNCRVIHIRKFPVLILGYKAPTQLILPYPGAVGTI
ncbi:hypothetical protein NXS19_011818 [Fusarium pseudograminearum]|nr:hypothetical protein NXS19_011818 [Fusarium pseudograminearum]